MSSTTGNEGESTSVDSIEAIREEAFEAGRVAGYAEGVACRRQLDIFSITPLASAEEQEKTATRPLSTPIEDLEFGRRTTNILEREGLSTIGTILGMSEEALAEIRNLGFPGISEVRTKLADLGYTLRAG